MQIIKFYYLYDSYEITWDEISSKGWRSIYVSINSLYYQLHIYDIVRLQQDYESEFQRVGFYHIDPNLILVEEVVVAYIKPTIKALYDCRYFEDIKPILLDDDILQQLVEF